MSTRNNQTEELVEAFLTASRAMVGIAIQSLAESEVELTLVQHRVLVLLEGHGELTVGDVAASLQVRASGATRLCDRLERLGLVARRRSETDARVVRVRLLPRGVTTIQTVNAQRRRTLLELVDRCALEDPQSVAAALRAFAEAAQEPVVLHGGSRTDPR